MVWWILKCCASLFSWNSEFYTSEAWNGTNASANATVKWLGCQRTVSALKAILHWNQKLKRQSSIGVAPLAANQLSVLWMIFCCSRCRNEDWSILSKFLLKIEKVSICLYICLLIYLSIYLIKSNVNYWYQQPLLNSFPNLPQLQVSSKTACLALCLQSPAKNALLALLCSTFHAFHASLGSWPPALSVLLLVFPLSRDQSATLRVAVSSHCTTLLRVSPRRRPGGGSAWGSVSQFHLGAPGLFPSCLSVTLIILTVVMRGRCRCKDFGRDDIGELRECVSPTCLECFFAHIFLLRPVRSTGVNCLKPPVNAGHHVKLLVFVLHLHLQ